MPQANLVHWKFRDFELHHPLQSSNCSSSSTANAPFNPPPSSSPASRGRNRGAGLNALTRSLSSCKISQSLRFFEMTTRTSQVSFRPKGEIFLSRMAQITLRRIHDLPKVLQVILQLRAELGAHDKVRLELKLSELAAH